MSKMINISNHPSSKWSTQQLSAVEEMGFEILDVNFPNVDPNLTNEELDELVMNFFDSISGFLNGKNVFMVQGEFGFTFKLVTLLKKRHVVYHATSERKVTEVDGKKIVEFCFCQFRKY